MNSTSRFAAAAIAAFVAAWASPSARAQELIDQAFGSAVHDEFGFRIAAFGPDLDGDGFAEIAISSRKVTATFEGSVTIMSGRDLTPIHTIDGESLADSINRSLAWCNDVDGDGIDDLAVGFPSYSSTSYRGEGKLRIYSTSTWTKLREYGSGKFGAAFGYSVALLADTDGDGVDELVIGAPGDVQGAGTSGVVYVYSGKSGGLLRSITLKGTQALGVGVADVGDGDGDGIHDLGAGAPYSTYLHPYAGAACVFSGADGSLLHEWYGSSQWEYHGPYSYGYYGDHFGAAIGAAGDFDGDGMADVWVASELGITGPAYLEVFSGATGATLRTMLAVDQLRAATELGDVTGDGLTDFAASGFIGVSRTFFPATTVLFSSLDGKELWRGENVPGNGFPGAIVAAAGDVNRDGLPDFAVGLPADSTVAYDAGRVDRLASNDLWLDVYPHHEPTAGDTLTTSAAEGPTGNLVGLFLTDVNGAPTFALLALSTFDAAGQAQWSGTIPSGYAGTTITLESLAVGSNRRLVSSSRETIAIQ